MRPGIDTMYHSCCISINNSSLSLTVTTLFDTGANPTSFVTRQVAARIESQQCQRALNKRKHSSAPTASVALAGTSLTSPVYGSAVTCSNETLYRLHANVIDSCIDIIVGRPVIREHHLVHKFSHCFDETTSSKPDLCDISAHTVLLYVLFCLIYMHCTYCNMYNVHTVNIIVWKHNPFDVDHVDESGETPEELLAKITFEGSEQLHTKLKALFLEFIDVFATKVRQTPADVEPMKIAVDEGKWRLPCNRAPPRRHSEEKKKEIRKQVDELLNLDVIKESQASDSQVHLVPNPTPEGACLRSGASLSTMCDSTRLPGHKVFGIIDFTAGYHQTMLHPDSQEYTAFITRVAMGLKGSGPIFQRSMANNVLAMSLASVKYT